MQRVAVLGLMALTACSDALEQSTSAGQVVVSVNAVSGTLSLVSVDDRSVSSVSVPPTGSAPRSIAVRGDLLAAPGGDAAALAVFDFSNGAPPVVTTRNLPSNSGATGVALESDSIAWVANPNRNSVTRVNVQTGDTASSAVGVYPQAVAVTGGRVYANGVLWGTFGTPTTISGTPEQSLDKLFQFPGTDLIPVGEASPGDRDYNGGRWDVRLVTFTGMEPTQFTSDDEVWYHASLGDLTISDTMGGFVCPLFAL